MNNGKKSVDMRLYLNFESVKRSVVYKLINTEKNGELLEDILHMDFLDLSIVFQCLVSEDELGMASMLVHNVHLRLWDVTVEELYKAARENTPKLMPHTIKSMAEVLLEIEESENPEGFDRDEHMEEYADKVPMYVLSNEKRVEGAACMLYHNLIRNFSDITGSSLYIIPSSVHELLLLPTKDTEEKEEIRSMIKEVNDMQVSGDEILSYTLYYYDREAGKICMV